MKTSSEIVKEKQSILNFIKDSNDSNLIKKLKEFIAIYDSENQEIPQNQKEELDNRLNSYQKNPENVLDWKIIKDNLLAR